VISNTFTNTVYKRENILSYNINITPSSCFTRVSPWLAKDLYHLGLNPVRAISENVFYRSSFTSCLTATEATSISFKILKNLLKSYLTLFKMATLKDKPAVTITHALSQGASTTHLVPAGYVRSGFQLSLRFIIFGVRSPI